MGVNISKEGKHVQQCRIWSVIRKERERMNFSGEDLSEQCSLNDKCIANIEHGKSDPKFSTVLILCKKCQINIGDLPRFAQIGECAG